MATIITCENIEQEADRLLQLFRSCYTLSGDDMDDLVNLAYSASLCGTGTGSIPTFDQNNIFTYRFTNSELTFDNSVNSAINTGAAFTVDQKEIVIYRHLYVDTSSALGTLFKEDHYLHMIGKGNFGSGGTALTMDNLYLLKSNVNAILPTTPGNTLPPRILNLYASDTPGSTISTPHLILNDNSNAIDIIDNQDTFFAVYNSNVIRNTNSPWNLYRFVGDAGAYGSGIDDSDLSDFLLVETFDGLPSTEVNPQIRIREIIVPAVINNTTINNVAEAVNSLSLGQINVAPYELLFFIVNEFNTPIGSFQNAASISTRKWAWNQGAQNNINADSVESDYTLIETYPGVSISGGSVSNDAMIYYTDHDSIDDVNDAVDAINAMVGANRVVKNDNLVLFKVILDDISNNYKIWEFTGATGGDGTYGVGGITAVAEDFIPTPVVDGSIISGDPVHASNVVFDDTVLSSGYNNVQEVLEYLKGLIDGLGVSSPFNTTGGTDPTVTISEDMYRTGRIALGTNTVPSELLHLVATESNAKGSIKGQYTYTSGDIVRLQFGGQNIYSELGLSTGEAKGFNNEYFANTTNYTNGLRSIIRGGDFSESEESSINLEALIGLSSTDGSSSAYLAARPLVENSGDEVGLELLSTFTDNSNFSKLTLQTLGTGVNYANEAATQLTVTNGTDINNFNLAPAITDLSTLFQLKSYGSGTYIFGYDHHDYNTTSIGINTYTLGVDSAGTIMEIPNASGLEAIDEGNGIGWRLVGRDPLSFVPMSENSIDFSTGIGVSSNYGPQGRNSFIGPCVNSVSEGDYIFVGSGGYNRADGNYSFVGSGYNNQADGDYSAVLNGLNNEANGNYSTVIASQGSLVYGAFGVAIGGNSLTSQSSNEVVIGQLNKIYTAYSATGFDSRDATFGIGIGNNPLIRKNAFTVFKDGVILAEELTNVKIDAADSRVLVTREYTEANYKLQSYTVATLPASPSDGDRAYVTDATAPTYLGTLTGGGAVVCPVFYNGTDWIS